MELNVRRGSKANDISVHLDEHEELDHQGGSLYAIHYLFPPNTNMMEDEVRSWFREVSSPPTMSQIRSFYDRVESELGSTKEKYELVMYMRCNDGYICC